MMAQLQNILMCFKIMHHLNIVHIYSFFFPNMEQLRIALTHTAVALVFEHNVNENTISSWIKYAIMDRAKDVKNIPIAYNACYGGYGHSTHFDKFLEDMYAGKTFEEVVEEYTARTHDKHDPVHCHSDRICTALAMEDYGKSIMTRYPEVADVYARRGTLKQVMSIARDIVRAQLNLACIQKNIVYIRESLDNGNSSHFLPEDGNNACKPMQGMLYDGYFHTWRYKRSDIEEFMSTTDVHDIQEYETSRIQELENKAAYRILPADVHAYILEYARKDYTRETAGPVADNEAFIDRVARCYPYGLEKAWSTKYDMSMAVLETIRKERPEWLHLFPRDDTDLALSLGCFCASSTFANLAIAHVPQFVCFAIREYDGLESVSFS